MGFRNGIRLLSLLSILVLLTSNSLAVGAGEGLGIGQKVTADVERSDYTIIQKFKLYCKIFKLDECDNGDWKVYHTPAVAYHYFFGPEMTKEDIPTRDNRNSDDGAESEIEVQSWSSSPVVSDSSSGSNSDSQSW